MKKTIAHIGIIIRQNPVYFSLFGLWFVFFLIYPFWWQQLDAIFFFSENRVGWADFFFLYWTTMGEFFPYVMLAILFFIFKQRNIAFTISSTGVVILIVSAIFKRTFEHLRPMTVLERAGLVEQINLVADAEILRGGGSFPSGHTMGGFALYTLLALIAYRSSWAQIGLFLAAAAVGVSRIYLVAHFPKDVVFGSFLGVLIAVFMSKLYFEKLQFIDFQFKRNKKLNQS